MTREAAIFLDKDGTLLEDVPFNVAVAGMRPAPGAGRALAALAALDRPLIVVSNQPGVGLGYFRESALSAVRDALARMFAASGATLAGFHYCPHAPSNDPASPACTCRKPAPGLLLHAAEVHGIDLERSWMVGDILDDVEAGARAGCRTVLIDNGNETEWRDGPLRRPDAVVSSLMAAASIISKHSSATVTTA
jgi:histidinol-phosphate phosphatase family protein